MCQDNLKAYYVQVTVTEVLGGGKFYVQLVEDQKVASIQQHLGSLSLQEAPLIGAFNPKRGDIVLAQFSEDNSWNRAMVRVKPDSIRFTFGCGFYCNSHTSFSFHLMHQFCFYNMIS